MGTEINCKSYAEYKKQLIKDKLQNIKTRVDKVPSLLICQIGNNSASNAYIKGKLKDCSEVGIEAEVLKLESDILNVDAIKQFVSKLGEKDYTGVIIQLPVPKQINARHLLNRVGTYQDVDGLKENETAEFKPCTPLGIINLLEHENIEISGKHVVIIGRSSLVGKPLAKMMLDKDATVTICHSKTTNLKEITKSADIIVSAVGKINLITPDMIKNGSILIDVGINRTEDNKLIGDISMDCYDIASRFTKVPGGIGLVTRVTLLENIVTGFKKRLTIKGIYCDV